MVDFVPIPNNKNDFDLGAIVNEIQQEEIVIANVKTNPNQMIALTHESKSGGPK